LIEGVYRLMNAEGLTTPVNIGNPTEFTVRELADRVVALTGSRSEIVHCPLPQDDPTQRQPDISLAREKLGWEARIPLEKGLQATIEYFAGRLSEDR
jgi:UDP-glucuronate decarboxylase